MRDVKAMRILFVGDIVGRSGRAIVVDRLPGLIRDWKLDFVVINGENAAGGFGITEAIYQDLLAPAPTPSRSAITPGTSARRWSSSSGRRGSSGRSIIPKGTPGRGAALIDASNGERVLVDQCHGPHLHGPARRSVRRRGARDRACPLKAGADAIIVDMHAEATSEKQAMGYFSTAG